MEVVGEEGGVRNTYELLMSRQERPYFGLGAFAGGTSQLTPPPAPSAATVRESAWEARGRRVEGMREARGERSTAVRGAT